LAELATKIAACRPKGQDGVTREKVIKGFLFDRVNTEPCAAAVGRQDHLLISIFPHKTKALISMLEPAMSWTQVALNLFIGNGMVPTSQFGSVLRNWSLGWQ
jgi:hypothetical protein